MEKKNVVIISSSPRKFGNSDTLCHEFEKGAKEAGHNVKYINLADMKIGYCIGCYACKNTGKCFQNDGMNEIGELLKNADVIAFGTPVYFYTMSGQLKVLIDRLVPFYEEISADIYIFATAWDSDTKNLELTAESIRGATRDCFYDSPEKGCLLVGGVSEVGAIEGRKELQQAYEMGKNV